MKSHVRPLIELVECLIRDITTRCPTSISVRDLQTVRSRVESQGISFLTITLPNFCKDFERSLDQESVDPQLFRFFRKNRSIPAFLQGLIGRIFDKDTGRMFDDVKINPQTYAPFISAIRQICLLFKKIKLPCTSSRTYKAVRGFVESEKSFNVLPLPESDRSLFERTSDLLWTRCLDTLRVHQLVPRHGPGATADRIYGNHKYDWRKWHARLEPYFPVIDNCFSPSSGELNDLSQELDRLAYVSVDDEPPSRIVTVPKTLKGPRVIAIEPCCMQYTQHAIADPLMDRLERFWLTRGHINFRDQSINQQLAIASSKDGQLATIDLSDASDRVPVGYALMMFRSNPDLQEAIEACRSTKAKTPYGDIVTLRKFASMGSALCFPIEAMYFYTICVVALLGANNLPVTTKNIHRVSRSVYVYGDDIVVPRIHVGAVLDCLRKYNCKVNTAKTFYTGMFRESCGVDAFAGEQVQPVYLTQPPPENRRQVNSLISWTAIANSFFKKGYLSTSQYMFSRVEKFLGKLPWVQENSSILGRFHAWPSGSVYRSNKRYQRREIRGWTMRPVYRTDRLDGYGALQKSLMKLEGLTDLESQRDPLHLERSALHDVTALARRWVPADINAGFSGIAF